MNEHPLTASDSAAATDQQKRRPTSMHEGIPVWCDCCSCEAEPRWIEVAEELGIDLDAPAPEAPVNS